MEYMETQAQNQLEASLHDQAYRDGLHRAAEILREGAAEYERSSTETNKVADQCARQMAATLLRSWANEIEIEAGKESGNGTDK